MRAAAILHPYTKDKVLEPFRDPRVNIFRGNELERGDLPHVALVFGGDGSVHRLLGPLAGSDTPLLIVPTGSGNDFAHAVGIRSVADSVRAWRRYLDRGDNVHSIDLGVLSALEDVTTQLDRSGTPVPGETFAFEDGSFPQPESRLGPTIMRQHLHHLYEQVREERQIYFCCIAGVGLDAEANARANRMSSWMRGNGGYIVSALRALWSHTPSEVNVEWWNQRDNTSGSFDGTPALLVAFGNAPNYGNGMRMLPRARLDDGLLDLCFVRSVPKLKVLALFHTIFSGNHLGIREVEYRQVTRLRVAPADPMPIYADGEYCGTTPVDVSVFPGALRLILP